MQRKIFRIEEMMSARRRVGAPAPAAQPGSNRDDVFAQVERELEAMRGAIARAKAELGNLSLNDAGEKPLARAQSELAAAISGMETGTGNILKEAEGADEAARNLVATLRDEYKRGLAQDIMDHVIKIYEHCNFQDLAGQRINKAIATLRLVEDKMARVMESWSGIERGARPEAPRSSLLNGPKLEGDAGHANQADIDRMFGSR